MHPRRTNCTLTKAASIPALRQRAQAFLDLFFDAAPHLEYFFQFLELSTKAAFAKAAFAKLSEKYENKRNNLGSAKTYILRGTSRTYANKTRAVTDNETIKKGPCKGNRGPVRGTDGPVSGTEGPVTGTGPRTKPLLIAPVPLTAVIQELSGTPNPRYFLKSNAGTNGRHTAVQMGGVLRYKWEAYCGTNGRHTAVQMGGVLRHFPFFKA